MDEKKIKTRIPGTAKGEAEESCIVKGDISPVTRRKPKALLTA
jgi:hypothetical protein